MSETAQEFGARVRRQRELLGLSQQVAARRAGLSPSGWRKIEQAANVGLPERTSVVKVARVLGWDPDAQLVTLGLEAMTDGERASAPREPRAELDGMWASLSGPQRWALVHIAATMVAPRQWPEFGVRGEGLLWSDSKATHQGGEAQGTRFSFDHPPVARGDVTPSLEDERTDRD